MAGSRLNVGAWVAVVTTVAAAVTAHAAAQRYEFLLIEYLRTAAELRRLLDNSAELTDPVRNPLTDDQFIRRCEAAEQPRDAIPHSLEVRLGASLR